MMFLHPLKLWKQWKARWLGLNRAQKMYVIALASLVLVNILILVGFIIFFLVFFKKF